MPRNGAWASETTAQPQPVRPRSPKRLKPSCVRRRSEISHVFHFFLHFFLVPVSFHESHRVAVTPKSLFPRNPSRFFLTARLRFGNGAF